MEENMQEVPEMNEEQKKDLLKILLKRALEDNKAENLNVDQNIDTLRVMLKSYEKKNNFEVGDILRWKKQLKNRKLPEYDEPVILLEILEKPIYNLNEQIGSTYFNEKMDIRVGKIKDNSFLTFYFDSSRFENY